MANATCKIIAEPQVLANQTRYNYPQTAAALKKFKDEMLRIKKAWKSAGGKLDPNVLTNINKLEINKTTKRLIMPI